MGNCCNNRSKEEENINEMKEGIIPNTETINKIEEEEKKDTQANPLKKSYNFNQNY